MHLNKPVYLHLTYLLVIIGALFVFWPALSGPFLFDDEPNLSPLGWFGGLNNSDNFFRYIFGGFSGPTGRPLSLLTFTLNAQNWPADPWGFKLTNLLLHIANALLVYFLSIKLSTFIFKQTHLLFALFVATIWLLHPIQLSTMMLVVQRMNELMVFFQLLAFIAYLHGRSLMATQVKQGYFWIGFSFLFLGGLSFLSKENGALLPLYILVIEYTLLNKQKWQQPPYWKIWKILFLWLPVIFIISYLAFSWITNNTPVNREFTTTERMLTEPRIVLQYLWQILLPQISSMGLFHDNYTLSTHLFDPITTLPAIIFITGLIGSALYYIRKAPVFSFAVLWFFGGHLLESTTLNLELYFEHRNYLPMLGPIIGALYYILKTKNKSYPIKLIAIMLYISFELFFSFQSSKIWGNELQITSIWAKENPGSIRAQLYLAKVWSQSGRYDKALEHISIAIKNNPNAISAHLQYIHMSCATNTFSPQLLEQAIAIASTAPLDNSVFQAISNLREIKKAGLCHDLDSQQLQTLVQLLLKNKKYSLSKQRTKLYSINAQLYADQGDFNQTITNQLQAYTTTPTAQQAMNIANYFILGGLYLEALQYVRKAKQLNNSKRLHSAMPYNMIEEAEAAIIKQIKASQIKNKS